MPLDYKHLFHPATHVNQNILWNRRTIAAMLLCVVVAVVFVSNTGIREIQRANDPINFVLVDPQPEPDDWPCWRGAGGMNAVPDSRLSLRWSVSENIAWQVSVPGRGHASPCIWGEKIFVTTADDHRQTISLICIEQNTGRSLWRSELHRVEEVLDARLKHLEER